MKGSRIFALLVLLVPLAGPAPGAEREAFRVGVLLWHDSANDLRAWEGVEAGVELAELPVEWDFRRVNGDADRARAVARKWEEGGADLIVTLGTEATRRAKEATRRIPVVFTAVTNPFGTGIVDSWEGSGTNLCGNSNWIARPDVFEVFQQAVPGLARLGVILDPENPVSIEEVAEAKRFFRAEPARALKLIEEGVPGPGEIEPADLERATRRVIERHAQAIWIPIDIAVYSHLAAVSRISMDRGIPLLASQASAVETDAVVGVAVDYRALGRKAAVYVKEVLTGRDGAEPVDPGTLPIGTMRSYQVIVNLSAARRTGMRIPLPLLATADRILGAEEELR